MKKVLSVILAVALLCGTFAGLQITSHAENIAGGTLNLDEAVNVSLTGGNGKWFYFTPSESGTYTFYTEGESDTYGHLYDSIASFNNNDDIYEDDDSGEGYNFSIIANLEAGTQYIILCTPYSDSAEFTLTVVSGEVDFDGGGESELPDSGVCGENVTYTFDRDTGLLTISGTGDMYDYDYDSPFNSQSGITAVIINDGVTSIGESAFYSCYDLTSVTIGSSVTSVRYTAFYCCSGLTSISVNPDNKYYDSRNNCNALIETASNTLITGCKNTVIPNTVTGIGECAFLDCDGFTSITIPDSVTTIDSMAFRGCSSLTSVTIPDSVASIAKDAFYCCSGLTSISVNPDNKYYDSRNNCNAIIKTETNTLIAGCKNTVIPNTVTRIAKDAFHDCSGLTSINIPDGVAYIDNGAFSGCTGLTSVIIPDSVTSIGDAAFFDCYNLTDVYYAGTEEEWNKISIDDGNEGLTNATIHYNSTGGGGEEPGLPESGKCGENVTYTFDSGTGTLTISGTGDMYDYDIWYDETPPFYNQSEITTVIINDGVTSIGDYAFYWCTGLTSVIIPDSVTSIGGWAFYYCEGLTGVIIPNSVTSIGSYAFGDCSGLTSITIPDSVTSIDSCAFQYCSRLTSITIPDSVTYIGGDVFTGTAYYKNESNWDNGVLYINNALIKAKDALSGAYNIKNGTTCIACGAFYGCSSLTSITIPDSVIGIGDSAFSGCRGLTNIAIPDSVTSIDGSAFYNCTGLTSIAIPDSVTSIGSYTFYGCSSLTSITIPDSVTSIGESAFYGTAYYKNNLNWNNGTLYIGNALIEAYSNNIKNGTTCIADRAFDGCSSLTSITIPDSVTSIGDYTFFDCSRLTSVTIPDSITSIGDYAFAYCTGLTDVYYAGTEAEWNDISIGDYGNDCLTNATIHFNSGGSGGGDDIQYTVSTLAGTGGTVYLYKGGELAYSAESADGTFTLSGVANGSYDVYVSCKFGVLTKVPEQLTVDGTGLSPVSDVYIAIGDVNGDGLVDVSDISSILLDGIYATSNADYDIDGSGAVDINDVSTVLLATNYGASSAKIV